MNKFYRQDHEQQPITIATINKDGTCKATINGVKYDGKLLGETKKFIAVNFGTFTRVFSK